jgi:predicted esterase
MLDLHNWGGVTFEGAPAPDVLARTFNVIAIGVQYYQSGDKDDAKDPVPYDFGYLQAMDAMRALHFVWHSLVDAKHPFDRTRIYGTGGSGGGNVIQMCNKFAPHTFACIVDLSGMASLTDDIAYNLPGGANLNARYSRDKSNPAYLAPGMQEIRDLGNPVHLALAAKLGNHCKVIVIHGEDDQSCLASDKRRVVEAMRAAALDVEGHFLAKGDADGKLIKNSGHSIGNRTELLLHFAGDYLAPMSGKMCRLGSPSDFERREEISYPTTGGEHVISFRNGVPRLSFSKSPNP